MKNTAILLIAAFIAITLQSCEKTDERIIFELSAHIAEGQDGFEYVLTKNEFLTTYDFPIQEFRERYGKESSIADWNDLKANFEDNFSGFLSNIGLSNFENHEGFFITKAGEHTHITFRQYMLTGKNNQQGSEWIILDNLDDSSLILAARYETGRILLKIPLVQ
jgi:hypothetical protein